LISIEEKMALFTKLVVNQLKEKYNNRVEELEKENAEEIHKKEIEIEEKGRKLYDQYVESAESEKKIRLSRVRSDCKKNRLLKQQELIEHLMDEVINRAKHFAKSDDYKVYLEKLLVQNQMVIRKYDGFWVYVTQRDYDHHKSFFVDLFQKYGFDRTSFDLKVSERDIIGGMAVVQRDRARQVDLTLRARIEENRGKMGSAVCQMLKEAGELNGNS